jgi:hypothetical protein
MAVGWLVAQRYERQWPNCSLVQSSNPPPPLFDLASAVGAAQEDRTVAAWAVTPSEIGRRHTVRADGLVTDPAVRAQFADVLAVSTANYSRRQTEDRPPLTPSWATFEVNLFDCTFGTADFLVSARHPANGLGTRRRYADAGDLSLDLNRVTSFDSGDNAGHFDYEPGDGRRYRHYFPKWERITKPYGFVVHLHID